jgi:cardiolipin synthase
MFNRNQIPNFLTLSRLGSLPFCLVLMFIDAPWAAWLALLIYTYGCVTDWLDGYLARKWNVTSPFGVFLDPIADKIFIVSVMLILIANGKLDGFWTIPPLLIIAREFLIAGLREFLGPKNISVPVTQMAKWKTGVQMGALGFLIMGDYGDVLIPGTTEIGYILITAAAVLTVMTGLNYLKEGMKHL